MIKAKNVLLESHFYKVEQCNVTDRSRFLDKQSCNMLELSSIADIKTISTKQGELIYPSLIAGLSQYNNFANVVHLDLQSVGYKSLQIKHMDGSINLGMGVREMY